MPIVVISWFAAFGRDRLIHLLTFAWRILSASLVGTCHPRRRWDDKRKRRKRNIANPVRTNVAISRSSWYWRTECSVLKPECEYMCGLLHVYTTTKTDSKVQLAFKVWLKHETVVEFIKASNSTQSILCRGEGSNWWVVMNIHVEIIRSYRIINSLLVYSTPERNRKT